MVHCLGGSIMKALILVVVFLITILLLYFYLNSQRNEGTATKQNTGGQITRSPSSNADLLGVHSGVCPVDARSK